MKANRGWIISIHKKIRALDNNELCKMSFLIDFLYLGCLFDLHSYASKFLFVYFKLLIAPLFFSNEKSSTAENSQNFKQTFN